MTEDIQNKRRSVYLQGNYLTVTKADASIFPQSRFYGFPRPLEAAITMEDARSIAARAVKEEV